jgi:hypothetical protein
MPTANRKQSIRPTPAQQSDRQMHDARRVDRAVRQDHTPTGEQTIDDIAVDHDFHAPAEDIEIDPLLDDSEKVEP